jgi:hypothetical protein
MYVKGHVTLRREPSTIILTQSDYSISVQGRVLGIQMQASNRPAHLAER